MTDHAHTNSQEIAENVHAIAQRAKVASRTLATATRGTKDNALEAIASALVANAPRIIEANALDLERGRAHAMTPGLLDRLALDASRIEAIAQAMREVATLPDPVGEVVRGSRLPNGLRLSQTRVPMGVVGMIYEARPNVTVDAAALCLKSGNAAILRGGSAAAKSNELIVEVMREALASVGLPQDLIQSIDAYGRQGGVALMHARGLVDVLVPRGGADLIQTVVRESTVPVIETGVGNCHIFIDESADIAMAVDIVRNSKTQRVGVCNAAETLLVHASIAHEVLPALVQMLDEEGVTLHADHAVQQFAQPETRMVEATDEDWATEYLALDLAVKIVDSLDQAIEHIHTWTSGHTEAIVTQSYESSERFIAELDSAAIMVNASTRFTDGGQFGLGAEIGISTQKLHARGPMGLSELTTTKWVVRGEGQVRP